MGANRNNGASHFDSVGNATTAQLDRSPIGDWLSQRLDGLFAQFAAVVDGSENVLRAELRLFEAKLAAHGQDLKKSAVRTSLGVTVAVSSYVLALVTVFFALHESFPLMPLWAIGLILTLSTLASGLVLLRPKKET